MASEIVSALIGLVGVILGVVPTYLFMRQRGLAEVEKLRAETDKTRAEAEKIRAELLTSNNQAQTTTQEDPSAPKANFGPPQILLPALPLGVIILSSGPRRGLWVFLTEQTREVVAGRADPAGEPPTDIVTRDMAMSKKHFRINVTPVESGLTGSRVYKLQLTDLMSANGTFVNGKMAGGTVDLQHGDLIEAGGSQFELRLFSDAARSGD